MAVDFTLNQHIDYGQENPDLAALPGGYFVGVWEDNDQDYGTDGFDGETGIYGAVFNAAGQRVTSEFKVPTAASDPQDQWGAQVHSFADGTWVVAWNSDGPDRHGINNDINVYFQRFGLNASGQVVRLGAQVQVTPDRPTGDLEGFFDQRLQDLEGTEDGGFRIVYAASDVDTDWEVYSQRFSSTGVPQGGERQMEGNIPTYLASVWTQYEPGFDIVSDGNGGFWGAYWEGIQGQPTGGSHIWLQHYADNGAKIGARISISAMGDPADNEYPVMTRLANGNMAIAWDYQHEEDLQDHDVRVRIVSANGTVLSNITQVNTEQPEAQSLGSILPLANGGFMITYMSWDRYDYPDDYYDVRARLFDAAGNAVGASFDISQYVYNDGQYLDSIVLTNGTVVSAWSSGDTIYEDVYGAIFDPSGGTTPPPTGTPGNDTLTGTGGTDTISGLGGHDTIYGLGGNDTLYGGSGNDVINGGTGADRMAGGTGDDRFYVDNTGDIVVEYQGEGTDSVYSTVNFSLAGQHIEKLYLQGTANINASGNNLANTLVGNSGNNILNGYGGADVMQGGAGDDTYYVDDPNDVIIELAGGGIDRVFATSSYSLAGRQVEKLNLLGTGNTNATGNSFANTLVGNSGSNILDGMTGADVMQGGAGNDIYYVDNVGDKVVELAGGGTDIILSTVSISLGGLQVENLTLRGSANLNGTGNSLNNVLRGNSGANSLNGSSGDDLLNGGYGSDTLTGGAGKDKFVFENTPGSGNIDTITDFSYVDDQIGLARSVFTALNAGASLAAEAFRAGTQALEADDRIIYNKANGNLYYDADGNGSGAMVQFAHVGVGTILGASDFYLI